MQCVVRQGEDFVFAIHDDTLPNVAALYPGGPVAGVKGKSVTIPAGEVVTVPSTFVFAYDAEGRRKDPRRWAGEGSTPIGAPKGA